MSGEALSSEQRRPSVEVQVEGGGSFRLEDVIAELEATVAAEASGVTANPESTTEPVDAPEQSAAVENATGVPPEEQPEQPPQDATATAAVAAPATPPRSGLTAEDTASIVVHDGPTALALKGVHTWDELPSIPGDVRQAILEKGWVKPSKIQETALPIILGERRNVIAQAQNGSGKTATFALGLVCSVDRSIADVQGILVSPTRELAKQNMDVINSLTKYTPITTKLIVPEETGMNTKITAQILSCTPGKLQDLLKKRHIATKHIKMFVLDEADVMIGVENNMGGTVSNIKALLAKDAQVLLFSATYTDQVRVFALSVVKDAIKIEVQKEDLTLQTIWQTHVNCGPIQGGGKYKVLSDLYAVMSMGQSVIFVNTRATAFELAKRLKEEGHAVSLICGTQKSGPEQVDVAYRDKVIDEFRSGVTKVLVATDVLSRGIDVPAVTMVVNYDLPGDTGEQAAEAARNRRRVRTNFETYLHRIGRTGRFGQRGIAVNLVFKEELERIRDIEHFYRNTVEEIKADIDELESKMNDIMKHRAMFE